jgi:formamidopyrimidine-DNA glycosylase
MPELPEVETSCRGLECALRGQKITRVEQRRADLRFPLPKNMPQKLVGRRITAVTRRAKYIVMALDDGNALLLHLGMSGRLVVGKAGAHDKHDHVVWHFADGQVLRFNDPRRFGMLDHLPLADLSKHKLLRHLGIEPLAGDLTGAKLLALFKGKKTSLKAALLDQRLVVGVGNIYACEAMFYARLSPKRRAGSLKPDEAKRLAAAVKRVLQAAIKAGGSSLRDYVQSDGALGFFQNNFAVYDRESQRCKGCDCAIKKTGGVQRFTQQGRSTFWCKVKQR